MLRLAGRESTAQSKESLHSTSHPFGRGRGWAFFSTFSLKIRHEWKIVSNFAVDLRKSALHQESNTKTKPYV